MDIRSKIGPRATQTFHRRRTPLLVGVAVAFAITLVPALAYSAPPMNGSASSGASPKTCLENDKFCCVIRWRALDAKGQWNPEVVARRIMLRSIWTPDEVREFNLQYEPHGEAFARILRTAQDGHPLLCELRIFFVLDELGELIVGQRRFSDREDLLECRFFPIGGGMLDGRATGLCVFRGGKYLEIHLPW